MERLTTVTRILILAVFAAFSSTSALAQTRPTWVIPVTDNPTDAQPVVANVSRGLREAGWVVITPEAAAQRYEATVSQPTSELSQRQIDEWVAHSTSAMRNLARADYDAARAELTEAQRISESASEELNREASRARQVLDTCLFLVRAFIETNDTTAAERQARECRRLVPRVEPSEFRHTPEVRDLLQRIDRAMSREPLGRLVVNSPQAGCAVRINGVSAGQTPFTLEDISQGEYRLQVECTPEERGRVHRINVQAGDNTLDVNPTLDAAFETRPYVFAKEASIDQVPVLAQLLGIDIVLLRRQGDRWGATIVHPGNDASVLAHAIGLGEGHDINPVLTGANAAIFADATANDETEEPETTSTSSSGGSAARLGVGISLMLAGVGSYAAATYFHIDRLSAGTDWVRFCSDAAIPVAANGYRDCVYYSTMGDETHRQAYVALNRARQDNAALPHVFGWVGGGLIAGGLALALPEQEGTPAWAWVAGGLGVAAAGTGAVIMALASDCNSATTTPKGCVDQTTAIEQGSMVMSAALPLITIPLTYLLFGRGDRAPQLDAEASATSFRLGLRGRF